MAVHAAIKKYPILLAIPLTSLSLIVWSLIPATIQAYEDEPTPHKILVLHSSNFGSIWTGFIQEGILSIFAETKLAVKFYAEYMNTKWYDPQLVSPHLINIYQTKYKDMGMVSIIRRYH